MVCYSSAVISLVVGKASRPAALRDPAVFACRRSSACETASFATDSNYISALAAANHFLHAWQNQDHETGIAMLTDTIKHQTSEDRLQSFFSPGSEAAYEIARGKRMKAGRYIFPITLFDPRTTPRPRRSQIVIIRAGKDDWAVDRLP